MTRDLVTLIHFSRSTYFFAFSQLAGGLLEKRSIMPREVFRSRQ